jgi:hypothetical protein
VTFTGRVGSTPTSGTNANYWIVSGFWRVTSPAASDSFEAMSSALEGILKDLPVSSFLAAARSVSNFYRSHLSVVTIEAWPRMSRTCDRGALASTSREAHSPRRS